MAADPFRRALSTPGDSRNEGDSVSFVRLVAQVRLHMISHHDANLGFRKTQLVTDCGHGRPWLDREMQALADS
jgi:hypothetical protein